MYVYNDYWKSTKAMLLYPSNTTTFTKEDLLVLEQLASFPDKISSAIENFKFREALSEMMNLARLGNKYLAETEPWKLIKTDEKRVQTIMNINYLLKSHCY